MSAIITKGFGGHTIITKGYFPKNTFRLIQSASFAISGYRPNSRIITIGKSDNMIFQDDVGVEIHFPLSNLGLKSSHDISIRLKNPSGLVFDVDGYIIDDSTVGYVTTAGEFSTVGTWHYQIMVRVDANTLYHLDIGKFRIRPSIGR